MNSRPECLAGYQTAPLPLKSAASFCVFHINKWHHHLSSNPSQKLGPSLCLSSALSKQFWGVGSCSVKWFLGVDSWSVFSSLSSVRWGHVTASWSMWSEHRWYEQSPGETHGHLSHNICQLNGETFRNLEEGRAIHLSRLGPWMTWWNSATPRIDLCRGINWTDEGDMESWKHAVQISCCGEQDVLRPQPCPTGSSTLFEPRLYFPWAPLCQRLRLVGYKLRPTPAWPGIPPAGDFDSWILHWPGWVFLGTALKFRMLPTHPPSLSFVGVRAAP